MKYYKIKMFPVKRLNTYIVHINNSFRYKIVLKYQRSYTEISQGTLLGF